MKRLSEKTIWITGASRGIGAAVARTLAKEGANLALSAGTINSFRNIMPDFTADHKVAFYPFDISNEESAKHAFYDLALKTGAPWALINNAGVGIFKNFLELDISELKKMIEVNLYGTFNCTKLVLPAMMSRGTGVIINILSVAALTPFLQGSGYAASKMSILGLSRSIREETRHYGIKVIDVFPGATETEIWDAESILKNKQNMIQPYDIAEIILDILTSSLNNRTMVEEVVIRPQKGDL